MRLFCMMCYTSMDLSKQQLETFQNFWAFKDCVEINLQSVLQPHWSAPVEHTWHWQTSTSGENEASQLAQIAMSSKLSVTRTSVDWIKDSRFQNFEASSAFCPHDTCKDTAWSTAGIVLAWPTIRMSTHIQQQHTGSLMVPATVNV